MTKSKPIIITACGRSQAKAKAVAKWWASVEEPQRRMFIELLFRRRPKSAKSAPRRAAP